GALGAVAYQRRVRGHPVGAECGEVTERFDQVGLALTVRADQHRDPRCEVDLSLLPGPEIGHRERSDIHPFATAARSRWIPGWWRGPRARRTAGATPLSRASRVNRTAGS